MTAAASGLVSGVKAGSANPFHFADWPKDWVAYYTDNKLMVIDPVLRWARNSGAPLTWSDLYCTLSPRDPGHRVFEASRRFGFSEGMVVPMRSSDNRLGVVSFGGPRGQISPADQALLAAVARCAFEAAERIETKGYVGRPAAILSAREIECLAILVRGHSDQQLAKLLGLSIPTVRFHLANARDKLGAKSRTHLAALAVAQGYVCL
jgi:DNA-binding CsgD family transcriptional regulator